MRKKNIAPRPPYIANVWRLPKVKLRRLNSSSGSIGSGVRRSCTTNSTSSAIPPRPTAQTSGLLQPTTGCRISARTGPARPKVVRTAPSQSRCTWRRGPLGFGTATATSPSVTSTNGTLMAKIQRHEAASTSQPPASGPITIAMPDHAVQDPIAPPRSSDGNVEMITASALGVSSAPNTPCSARPATSTSIVGASAQTIETMPKPATPIENTRRSP